MDCAFKHKLCDIEYIKDRIDDQIEWYSNKSTANKKWHYIFKISEIILTSLITSLSLFAKINYMNIVIALISLILAVVISIHTFLKPQENWIEYRKTSEILKHEKYMYQSMSGVYNIEDEESRFRELVERCETIISHENINWAQLNSNEPNKSNQ